MFLFQHLNLQNNFLSFPFIYDKLRLMTESLKEVRVKFISTAGGLAEAALCAVDHLSFVFLMVAKENCWSLDGITLH